MNLDVDMGAVASDLADQVRDLTVENLILKKALEGLAEKVKELESANGVLQAELSMSGVVNLDNADSQNAMEAPYIPLQ